MAFGPSFDRDGDERLRRLAAAGEGLDRMARTTGRPRGEILVRLVELELGPLGRVRPLPPEKETGGPFRDVDNRSGTILRERRQAPILRLAAAALGPSLQRIGDRLYFDGVETDLPSVVARARSHGAAIRYPGLDPMERTFAAGPSSGGASRSRRTPDGLPRLTGVRP